MDYEPFIVAHLVKFERPQSVAQYGGKVQGLATDFTYISDAQYDISFDDGGKTVSGVAIGPQLYRANKVLKLGVINESIQAKASNLSLTLDSSTLGTSENISASFTSTHMTTNVDLASAGFREGDKVLLTGAGNSNNNKYLRIDTFSGEGKIVAFTEIDSITSNSSLQTYVISSASEEINSLITDKTSTSYTSYINRDVLIYRVHINPDTRAIIGEPYIYFKGIIGSADISEKLDSSTITWKLASHWGDFIRVQGRLTDDATHRALQAAGTPDLSAVIRPEYATDLGFLHANTALNLMATYNTTEISYKQVDINGGWFGGKRLREVETIVPRTTDLQFNIQAKMLPVVYGVRKIDSFPIFVDTHKDTSAEIYRVDALCEGKIAGILDIHIEDNSTICTDLPDFDLRNTAGANYDSESVEVACYGRADRGDTMSHYSARAGAGTRQRQYDYNERYGEYAYYYGTQYQTIGTGTNNPASGLATGILHGGTHTITSPLSASFSFYQGKPYQKADNTLVNLASANNFKLQNDYYTGRSTYWGANHKLLDTAYCVGKYTIAEGETSLPDLKFIVRGRDPECYNYDGSYRATGTGAGAGNALPSVFVLGADVTLHRTDNDVAIGGTVQIIDKWSTFDSDGVADHRFRWSVPPALGNITAFYMKSGSSEWHMQTWDHVENSGTVPAEAYVTIASTTAGTAAGRKVTINTPSAGLAWLLAQEDLGLSPYIGEFGEDFASTFRDYTPASASVIDNVAGLADTVTAGDRLYVKDGIILASGASSTNGYYVGNTITVTDISGALVYTQVRKITGYDGATRTATVDAVWDYSNIPNTSTKYVIGSIGDKRVTINPAMQLLDYMTNDRYGKGLDIDNDIDLPAWIASAEDCDSRSAVSIVLPSATSIAEGQKWRYPATGVLQWQGTVSSVVARGSYKEVTFEDCIGKLGNKWNDWKTFAAGELYWYKGVAYNKNSSAGTISTKPTGTSGTSAVTVTIKKVTDSTTANVDTSLVSANGNPIVKAWSPSSENYDASGYSLYDSDDVKYWRYVGWDDSVQRAVTRHQTNQVVNTTNPLFDNINRMLSQFNGILRYSGGKYQLAIKGKKPTSVNIAEQISNDDIIGTIKLSDKGLKNSKNFVSTSIVDPQNKFEGRSVSFFNSEYLKEDKGIQKKGSFSLPGVTNYHNARFNIKQYLDESRYGLEIQFRMAPRGLLLLAGSIIELTYPRFGYTAKEFRITNLNFTKDGLVDVTADEHNDSAYVVEPETSGALGLVSDVGSGGNTPAPSTYKPGRPSRLVCTQNEQSAVSLTWTNTAPFTVGIHLTEIYRSSVNNFADSVAAGSFVVGTKYRIATLGSTTQAQWNTVAASTNEVYKVGDTFTAAAVGTGSGTVTRTLLVGTSDSDGYIDPITTGTGSQERYYWIRYITRVPVLNRSGAQFRNVASPYFPNSNDSGFGAGQGIGGIGAANNAVRSIKLSFGTTNTFVYETDGTGIEAGYPNSTTLTATATNIVGTDTYVWKKTSKTGTVSVISGATGLSYTYIPPNAFTDIPETISVHLTDTVGSDIYEALDAVSFSGTRVVIDGTSPSPTSRADLSNDNHTIPADFNGANGTYTGASTTLTILEGTTDVTSSWSISTAASSGTTISGAGTASVAVTAMNNSTTSGTVTFTATRSGYANLTAVFSVTKQNAATPGTSPIVYRIGGATGAVNQDTSGTFTPANFTANAQKIDGNSTPVALTSGGTLKVYRNGSGTAVASSTNGTITWPVTSGTTTIRVTLEVSNTVVDEETIPIVSDGVPGSDGIGVDIIFKRAASASAPTASASANNSLGWYDTVSSVVGTGKLWASKGVQNAAGLFVWTTPYEVEGEVAREVYIYRRNNATSTAPALPTSGNLGSYNFATNSLSVVSPWSTQPLSLTLDEDRVWVYVATVSGHASETVNIPYTAWTGGALYAQREDGDDADTVDFYFKRIVAGGSLANPGSAATSNGWNTNASTFAGLSGILYAIKGTLSGTTWSWGAPYAIETSLVREIAVYRRNSTAFTDNGTFRFAAPNHATTALRTDLLTAPTSWSTIPLNTQIDGDIVYKSICLVTGEPGQTVTPSWGSPKIYTERNDGGSVNIAFKRSTTVPTTNPGTSPTYPSSSNGWYDNPAAATGTDPLYAIKGNLSGTTWSWGGPYRVDGQSAAEIYFYSDIANPAGTAPSFTAPTYNFTTNAAVSVPSGWNTSPPSLVNNGDTVYVVVVLYAGSPSDTAASAQNTSAVSVYAQKTDGDDGEGNIVAQLSNPNVIITANNDGTVPSGNFLGSGTDLQLFEGTTPIRYANSGTTAGTFAVGASGNGSVVSSSGITRGAGTQVGTSSTYFLRLADASAMTTDTGTITFNIVGKKLDGTAFAPFSIVQSFSKSKTGDTVDTVDFYFKRIVAGGSTAAPGSGANANGTPSTLNGWYTNPASVSSGAGVIYTIKGTFNGTTWSWGTPIPLQGSLVRELSVFARQVAGAGVPGFVASPSLQRYGSFTFAIPSGAAESFTTPVGWDKTPQTLAADGDIIWESRVVVSGEPGQTVQPAGYAALTKYAQRTDGTPSTVPGPSGLRTIQGYLYYEKSTNLTVLPLAPTFTTYTIASGDINGGTGANEVLGLSDPSTVNKWTNEPRTQDPTSPNKHYTIRYYGTEAAANSTTITVTYSSVVTYTNFDGVVTFSNGTFSSGGTSINGTTAATTIDGGNITTGTINAQQLAISNNSAGSAGIFMDSTNNRIDIRDGSALRVRIGQL